MLRFSWFGDLLFHAADSPYVVLLMYRQILDGVERINIGIQRRLRPESF
jgi:hypothetical protein